MMSDKHDSECGCGGICDGTIGKTMTKDEKITHLKEREAMLKKKLEHVQKVKEDIVASKEPAMAGK